MNNDGSPLFGGGETPPPETPPIKFALHTFIASAYGGEPWVNRPKGVMREFPTQSEAMAAQAAWKAQHGENPDAVSCVTPVPAPKATPPRPKKPGRR
jgi:hypothetical protein